MPVATSHSAQRIIGGTLHWSSPSMYAVVALLAGGCTRLAFLLCCTA
jgi:hypothetical protein